MTRVKRWMPVMLLGVFFGAAGCMGRSGVWINDPHAGFETLGETGAEHRERVSAVADQDARALVEDFDLLFMTDRPTRLTRWHGR